MKQLLQILFIPFLVSSCATESELEGTWIGAYTISDSIKKPISETTLFRFEDNQLHTITISNQSIRELDKISIDTTEYKLSNGKLELKSYSPSIQFSRDSMTLEFEYEKLMLRRIPENLKNLDINSGCFRGSYFIQSKYYQDSIDFVNDSLLIYTGENHQNSPGKKWQIVDYGGFKFLNINDVLDPVTIIKSCNSDRIDLFYLGIQNIDIKLSPTKGQIDKEQLIGEWIEIVNSNIPPPPHPNLSDEDYKRTVKVNGDSMKIKKFNRLKTHKWALTSDGKRIYFPDILLENEGSWKLLNLTDSSMTVRMSGQSEFKKEIVRFKKEKNNP